jgi:hypothetical protein
MPAFHFAAKDAGAGDNLDAKPTFIKATRDKSYQWQFIHNHSPH